MHAQTVCFMVTTFNSEIEAQKCHISRLLPLTGLRAMQWINLNRTAVKLVSIQANEF
jgi:hypothetical protein